MQKTQYITSVVILLIFWLISCHKIETYPDTPQIEYKEFSKNDSSIVFSFIDGDGDLGFDQGDSLIGDSVLKHNLFITLYNKVDTNFQKVLFDIPLFYIIPNVVPQGQNKTLKGEIKFTFNSIKPFEYDTFKFEFYIVDNALHKSNKEITPPLTFN
ncbi:MAG: hypothetical protein GXO79_15920 [Chlorobi bacterium]|nr:hypothetical protein [Chlorobiota bacterium]